MRVEEPDVVETDDPEERTETVEVATTDNVGDPSVEINVEALINEIETEGIGETPECEQAAKRRLEEIMELKRAERELEDFDDYDV